MKIIIIIKIIIIKIIIFIKIIIIIINIIIIIIKIIIIIIKIFDFRKIAHHLSLSGFYKVLIHSNVKQKSE
jgi:hypothetical protein